MRLVKSGIGCLVVAFSLALSTASQIIASTVEADGVQQQSSFLSRSLIHTNDRWVLGLHNHQFQDGEVTQLIQMLREQVQVSVLSLQGCKLRKSDVQPLSDFLSDNVTIQRMVLSTDGWKQDAFEDLGTGLSKNWSLQLPI